MDDHAPSTGCEALLSQTGWVRELARHLTADSHAADDLAQDALAAALVHPPPDDRPLRSWLAGIVRNLARERRRGAGNRSARELDAARGGQVPSSADLLERLESHRAVVEAVARLEEPYRTVVLLRYFEGLSPSAIAARTASPLRTVHTRLHRALARLREDLDRAHGGDGRSWLLALVPFARGSESVSAWSLGGLLMDVKLKVTLAAVVVVGVCSTVAFWPHEREEARAIEPAGAPITADAGESGTDRPVERLETAPSAADREVEAVAPVSPSAPSGPAEKPHARLVGRVIDVDGAPVGAVQIGFFDAEHDAVPILQDETDARGAFELEMSGSSGRIDVVSADWTTILRPEFPSAPEPTDRRELVLVVARGVKLGGAVVDDQRRGIDSATVAITLPFGLRSRFDAILDRSTLVERRGRTAADGSFEIAGVPLVEGARLSTAHARYLPDDRPIPTADELALEIVLRSVTAEPERIVGTVVDPDGVPVEGAWVRFGDESAKSGAEGAFSFDRKPAGGPGGGETAEPRSMLAAKKGHLPGSVERAEGAAWPDPLVLQLGPPPLAIAGRVVDADGRPVANAEVWTDSEERFGYVEIEGGEMSMRAGTNVEGILRGDPWKRRFLADRNGRFELTGLLPKDYRVHAIDKERLLAVSADFAAGVRDVELRMPKEDLLDRVAGRVTSLAGDPVEGLEVRLERAIAGVKGLEVEPIASVTAKTDEEGRFEFKKVSRSVSAVSVQGSEVGLMGVQRPIRPEDDLEKIEISAPMQVHVQVETGGRTDFNMISVLDEKGEKLYLALHHGHSAYAMRDVPLQGERTEVFAVTELGRTLVLYRGEEEVQRVEMKLVRGGVNTIRP